MNLEKPKLFTKEYLIVTFVNFLVAINFYLLIIIISEFAINKFNAPLSQAGFSVSIFIIGALVMRLFVGKWLMRFGYKRILVIGIIANVITSLAYFWINSILLLLMVRLIHGATLSLPLRWVLMILKVVFQLLMLVDMKFLEECI
jgi:MFS family permease